MNLPEFTLASFQPAGGWLHYLNILHYLLMIGAVALLGSAGEKSPIIFLIVTAALMLFTAADLYSDMLGIPFFAVFLMRVGMLGIPMISAGLGPTQQARGLGILAAIPAFLILLVLFLGAWLSPSLTDPRLF
jgi:hypothetical protein